jgi:hypothetical protein
MASNREIRRALQLNAIFTDVSLLDKPLAMFRDEEVRSFEPDRDEDAVTRSDIPVETPAPEGEQPLGELRGLVSDGEPAAEPDDDEAPAAAPPPADFAGLLENLPEAAEGDVISADNFNALRAAIVELAAALGGVAFYPVSTLTFSPALWPITEKAGWAYTAKGIAAEGGEAEGWMPLALPDRCLIEGVTVLGERSGGNSGRMTLEVTLHRHDIKSRGDTVLCKAVPESYPPGRFRFSEPAVVEDAEVAKNDELRRVDNALNRYWLRVAVADVPDGMTFEVHDLQVTISR